jgi:hypothetical protein
MSAGERNRAIAAWDRIGHCGLGDKCRWDHVLLKIENDETANTNSEGKHSLPSTIPDDVMRDGILWEPDWEEIRWERALARQRLFEQQLRERELLEQRQWLTAATQRMAEVALELDAAERRSNCRKRLRRTTNGGLI